MAALANIALNDSVPAAHTFEPAENKPGLITYHDRSGGVTVGYPSLSLGSRLPTNSNRNHKATVRVRIPVLETSATAASGFTPGPTLSYSLMANVDFVIPDRSTALEKANLLAYVANALDSTPVGDLVTDAALPY